MRFRTDPALIRTVLIDAERSSIGAAAARAGMHRNTVHEWRRRADDTPGEWPTDLDIARWRERRTDREANRTYRKTRYTNGRTTIDPTGTRRRLQALYALGWTWDQLGARLGGHKNRAHRIANGHHSTDRGVYIGTAERVAKLYGELSMIRPEGWVAERARTRAARLGYAPPLAWDCIDTDVEPTGLTDTGPRNHGEMEIAVIYRLLRGERITSTRAEKEEAMRKWLADGNSQRELCLMHGWKQGRYSVKKDAA